MYSAVLKWTDNNDQEQSEIFYDEDPSNMGTKLIDPKLILEENTAGSFSSTVPYTHDLHDFVSASDTMDGNFKLFANSELIIYENYSNPAVEIWRGRPVIGDENSYFNQIITFEGELTYLNDSIQYGNTYSGEYAKPKYIITDLLSNHNSRMPIKKQFEIGNITVGESYTEEQIKLFKNGLIPENTEFTVSVGEHTLDCILRLISVYGGFIQIRHVGEHRYLDYLMDSDRVDNQSERIDFGKNLLDYASDWNFSNVVTALLPIGETWTDDDGNSHTCIIENLEYAQNAPFVLLSECYDKTDETEMETFENLMAGFGRRETCINFPNVENSGVLYNYAISYLRSILWDGLVLTLKALDLAMLGFDDYEHPEHPLTFHNYVRAYAAPYNLNKKFPLTRIEIPLDRPEETVYTMSNTSTAPMLTTTLKDHEDRIKDTEEKEKELEDE